MDALASRRPTSASRMSRGRDHWGAMGAAPPPAVPTRQPHLGRVVSCTHHHKEIHHAVTHAARGVGANTRDRQEEGTTPRAEADPRAPA